MLLSPVVRRLLIAGMIATFVSGCANFEMPEPAEFFKTDNTGGKVKRDGMGNPVLTKS
ncbi:MAG: hypothetical protein HN725_09945 [Alphaproteobacteria bacterium]|jgi:hypothetical protein|nr:hypothetical protein [Alphaproteobacteria bacterium]MBT4082506.1 hypothetical protein [Alphaproteobacteria bacterium]MBT4543504.1 hypothetical protein [Alphaproteobacteria bacterium]MBT6385548.1 hypothetical protein [Alphaproteobacteria bacterium]MBT7745602.1 hypothetical protein [Alphaproteobacteria bacterium]